MKRGITALLFLLISYFAVGQSIQSTHPSGIYLEDFNLNLEANENIHYTINGEKVTSNSPIFQKSITIKESTVVRAATFLKNTKISDTSFFFFLEDREPSLPILSISTNPDDLFDYDKGIYVKGCCADSVHPYFGANYWRDIELECNFLFIENGKEVVNQNCGLKIFGGWSRTQAQKSLAFYARGKYGKKKFFYPFFPEKPELKKYDGLIIRNSGSDFNDTHYRDALMTQMASKTGLDYQAYKPVIVFINGTYWGVQNLREKLNEYYLKSNHRDFKINTEKVNLIKKYKDVKSGSYDGYAELKSLLRKNLKEPLNYMEVTKRMDVVNFAYYNASEVFFDNVDAGGNVRYWKHHSDTAKWRWIIFDMDFGMSLDTLYAYKRNSVINFTTKSDQSWPYPNWSTFVVRKLLTNTDFKELYLNTFLELINHTYTTEKILAKSDSIQELIKDEMPYHFKRWRNVRREKVKKWPQAQLDEWEKDINRLTDFAKNRKPYLLSHLMQRFDIEDTVQLKLIKFKENRGEVFINQQQVKNNYQGTYFQLLPITIEAKAYKGYKFLGWKEFPDSNATMTLLLLEKEQTLTPVFKKLNYSPYKNLVIINEFSKKQEINKNDWIEIYNKSNQAIDLSNWSFCDKKGIKNNYIFPEGTKILADSFLILFQKESLNQPHEVGPFHFGLSNEKDAIGIYDSKGRLVNKVTWDSTWNKDHYAKLNPSLSDIDTNWIYQAMSINTKNPSHVKILAIFNSYQSKIKRTEKIGYGLILIGLICMITSIVNYKQRRVNG